LGQALDIFLGQRDQIRPVHRHKIVSKFHKRSIANDCQPQLNFVGVQRRDSFLIQEKKEPCRDLQISILAFRSQSTRWFSCHSILTEKKKTTRPIRKSELRKVNMNEYLPTTP
jgi:hypothetical protein